MEVLPVGEGSREAVHSRLLAPGVLDHRLLQQWDRPSHCLVGADVVPLEDIT